MHGAKLVMSWTIKVPSSYYDKLVEVSSEHPHLLKMAASYASSETSVGDIDRWRSALRGNIYSAAYLAFEPMSDMAIEFIIKSTEEFEWPMGPVEWSLADAWVAFLAKAPLKKPLHPVLATVDIALARLDAELDVVAKSEDIRGESQDVRGSQDIRLQKGTRHKPTFSA